MRNILRTLTILVFLLAGASVSAQYYYLPSTINGNPGGLIPTVNTLLAAV